MALHGAGEALADRGAGDIHQLPDDEMVRLHRCADLDEVVSVDTEFDDLALGLHLGDGELAAIRLGEIARLNGAGAELQGDVTVFFFRPLGYHLAVLQTQHRDRYVRTVRGEYAGHAQLLCDQTRTHRLLPFLSGVRPGH